MRVKFRSLARDPAIAKLRFWLRCWVPGTVRLLRFLRSKADAMLFNRGSQVVLARDGDRTILTMANDFKGDPKEFAVVIPVPTVIRRDQIRVADRALMGHIDAYSAPRLVEYFDDNPCRPILLDKLELSATARGGAAQER